MSVIEVPTVKNGDCFFDALSKTGGGIQATREHLADWMARNLDTDLGLRSAGTLRDLLSQELLADADAGAAAAVPWSCGGCTLDNAPLFPMCAACGLVRTAMFAQGAEVRFHPTPAAKDDEIVDATIVAVNSSADPPCYSIVYICDDAVCTAETDSTCLSLACAPAADQPQPVDAVSIDDYISSLRDCKAHWAGVSRGCRLSTPLL